MSTENDFRTLFLIQMFRAALHGKRSILPFSKQLIRCNLMADASVTKSQNTGSRPNRSSVANASAYTTQSWPLCWGNFIGVDLVKRWFPKLICIQLCCQWKI